MQFDIHTSNHFEDTRATTLATILRDPIHHQALCYHLTSSALRQSTKMCFGAGDDYRNRGDKRRSCTEHRGTEKNGKRRSCTERAGREMIPLTQRRQIPRLEDYGYRVQDPMLADFEGTQYYQVDLSGTHIATLGYRPSTPNTLYINQIYTANDMRPGHPHASDIYMSFWYRHVARNVGCSSPLRNFIFENVEEARLESVVKAIHRDARDRHAYPVWSPAPEHKNFNAIRQTPLLKSIDWLLQDYKHGAEMRGMQIRSCKIQLLSRIRSGEPPDFNLRIEIS